jgi:hypothetical protein
VPGERPARPLADRARGGQRNSVDLGKRLASHSGSGGGGPACPASGLDGGCDLLVGPSARNVGGVGLERRLVPCKTGDGGRGSISANNAGGRHFADQCFLSGHSAERALSGRPEDRIYRAREIDHVSVGAFARFTFCPASGKDRRRGVSILVSRWSVHRILRRQASEADRPVRRVSANHLRHHGRDHR